MIQYACGAIAFCISCLAHARSVERVLFKYWEFEGRDQIAYSMMFGAVLIRCLTKALRKCCLLILTRIKWIILSPYNEFSFSGIKIAA